MRGSIWLLAPLAGLAGAALAGAVGEPARPWFVASVAVLTALEVFVARTALERAEAGDYLRWRRAELIVLAIGMRLAQAITGGAGGLVDPALGNRETLVSLLVIVAIRSAVNATIDDLDAIEGALHRSDGTDPMMRIRGRVIGYLVVVVLSTGYTAVGMRGLFDLTREPARSMPVTPLIFLALALPGVAYAAFRAEMGRWRRDGAAVDDAVGAAWIRRSVAIGSVVILVAVGTWNVAGVSGVGAAGLVGSGSVGEWIAERLGAIGDREVGPAAERGEGEVIDPVSELDTDRANPPEWLGEAMLLAIAATVIWWAVVRGRNAGDLKRKRRSRAGPLSIGGLLGELWRMLTELWHAMVRLLRRARGGGTAVSSSGTARRSAAMPWSSADPFRNRIARSYRRGSKQVATRSGLRRRGETPREFAARVAGDQPNQATDLSSLTSSYEEARFSVHPLEEERAAQAEQAADRVERRSREDPTSK